MEDLVHDNGPNTSNGIFQHDNTLWHTAWVVREKFQEHEKFHCMVLATKTLQIPILLRT